MVDFDENKNALPQGHNLTDKEIQKLTVRAKKIAQMLFEIWNGKLCKESKITQMHKRKAEKQELIIRKEYQYLLVDVVAQISQLSLSRV